MGAPEHDHSVGDPLWLWGCHDSRTERQKTARFWVCLTERKLDPSLVQNHDFGFLSGTSLTATVEKADQSGYLVVCSVSYCPMRVFLEGECSVEKGDLSR